MGENSGLIKVVQYTGLIQPVTFKPSKTPNVLSNNLVCNSWREQQTSESVDLIRIPAEYERDAIDLRTLHEEPELKGWRLHIQPYLPEGLRADPKDLSNSQIRTMQLSSVRNFFLGTASLTLASYCYGAGHPNAAKIFAFGALTGMISGTYKLIKYLGKEAERG